MSRVVILAPWRPGDEHRERSWAIVKPWLEELGWPIFEADSGTPSFSVAQAYNLAAEQAGDWDYAVAIGTDCIQTHEAIRAGVERAKETGNLILPHDEFHPLKRNAFPVPPIDEEWRQSEEGFYGRMAPAGVLVIPRPVWDRVGGYDDRFVDWGYEDSAFLVAAGYFERLHAPLYHYWHPPRWKGGNAESRAIFEAEYKGRAPEWMLVGPGALV